MLTVNRELTVMPEPSGAATPAILELRALAKRFGSVGAVERVDLVVHRGELFTLLGPSGSGKTTILRLIAGFDRPSAGRILLEGRDISALSPAQRGIGMVFQHYALFPHLTVFENIRYPLKLRRWSTAQTMERVREMLRLVDLEGLGDRYPRHLSGGQQQRVAVARALAFRPALLLMDEPLGALDRNLRVQMQEELRRVHCQSGATIMYVTHDVEEAFALSDRVGVLSTGRLLQEGAPRVLYERPATTFVARFLGEGLLVPVERIIADNGQTAHIRVLGQEVEVPVSAPLNGRQPHLLVRPSHVRLGVETGDLAISARVAEIAYLGETIRITFQSPDVGQIVTRVPSLEIGALDQTKAVRLAFRSHELVVVPEDEDRRSG